MNDPMTFFLSGVLLLVLFAGALVWVFWAREPDSQPHDEAMKRLLRNRDVEEAKRGRWQ